MSPTPHGPRRQEPTDRMMPEYKRTFMDKYGADSGYIMRCVGRGFIIAMTACGIAIPMLGFFLGLLVGLTAGTLTFLVSMSFAHAGAATVQRFVAPDGSSTPYQKSYSMQESLAIRGDVPGALTSYEEIIAAEPYDFEARVRAAELYAMRAKNPTRAAELFREVQRIPGVSPERELYATHRLVDLYRGALGDEGRALVELRRVIDRFPGSPAATHARTALVEIKRSRARVDEV